MVTMCHNPTRRSQWAQHPLPPTTIPPLHPQLSSASTAATLSNQPVVPVGATVGGSLKRRRCTVRSPLPPTTVSSTLALLLVTMFVLTRKTLLPPVRPAGHGNSPMRRLSLGPAPSYRSSSNNTNTVSLPPTPPITPSSVIPFVTPQQPQPLHRLQHRTLIYLSRRRYDEW